MEENNKEERNLTEEVFQKLKDSISDMTLDHLNDDTKKAFGVLASTLETDQTELRANALRFLKDVEIEKEIIKHGYIKYFTIDDLKGLVVHYSIENNTNILFNELKEFERIIPDKNRKDIAAAIKTGLFNKFYIMYTDYTNDGKMKTKSKPSPVSKDPIVFATPKSTATTDDDENTLLSNRMYVITDWVDHYCDLDLSKLIQGIDDTDYKIYDAVDHNDVDIVKILQEFGDLKDHDLLVKLMGTRFEENLVKPKKSVTIKKYIIKIKRIYSKIMRYIKRYIRWISED